MSDVFEQETGMNLNRRRSLSESSLRIGLEDTERNRMPVFCGIAIESPENGSWKWVILL